MTIWLNTLSWRMQSLMCSGWQLVFQSPCSFTAVRLWVSPSSGSAWFLPNVFHPLTLRVWRMKCGKSGAIGWWKTVGSNMIWFSKSSKTSTASTSITVRYTPHVEGDLQRCWMRNLVMRFFEWGRGARIHGQDDFLWGLCHSDDSSSHRSVWRQWGRWWQSLLFFVKFWWRWNIGCRGAHSKRWDVLPKAQGNIGHQSMYPYTEICEIEKRRNDAEKISIAQTMTIHNTTFIRAEVEKRWSYSTRWVWGRR